MECLMFNEVRDVNLDWRASTLECRGWNILTVIYLSREYFEPISRAEEFVP